MRKLFFLAFGVIVSTIILGCGEEAEPEPAPWVMSVSANEGNEIPCNAIITVAFNEDVGIVFQ